MDAITLLISAVPDGFIGAGSMAFLIFVLLATGKLHTAREMQDARDREAKKDETIDRLRDALIKTLTNDQTTVELLKGIKRIAESNQDRDGDGNASS